MNSQNQLIDRIARRMHYRLQELGYNISWEWTLIYAHLFQEYLTDTLDGKEYIVELFKFEWTTGESDQEYEIADTNITVPGEQVHFLKGAVVQGKFISPTHLDEFQIVTEKCNSCGIWSHCFKDAGPNKLCDHCLNHTEEFRHLSEGRCKTCTINNCHHHSLYFTTR